MFVKCVIRQFYCTVHHNFPTAKCLVSTLDFGTDKEKKIAPELDELLSHIAKTGRTEYGNYIFHNMQL